jgi:hypothetical protein
LSFPEPILIGKSPQGKPELRPLFKDPSKNRETIRRLYEYIRLSQIWPRELPIKQVFLPFRSNLGLKKKNKGYCESVPKNLNKVMTKGGRHTDLRKLGAGRTRKYIANPPSSFSGKNTNIERRQDSFSRTNTRESSLGSLNMSRRTNSRGNRTYQKFGKGDDSKSGSSTKIGDWNYTNYE